LIDEGAKEGGGLVANAPGAQYVLDRQQRQAAAARESAA